MAIIFIPGIKGSELDDSYPLDWPTRWSMKDMVIGEVFDSPDDLRLTDGRYDSGNGHWMQPTRIIRYAYASMLGKLRTWKSPEPVYAFSYDSSRKWKGARRRSAGRRRPRSLRTAWAACCYAVPCAYAMQATHFRASAA
jgi:hypothetical protein